MASLSRWHMEITHLFINWPPGEQRFVPPIPYPCVIILLLVLKEYFESLTVEGKKIIKTLVTVHFVFPKLLRPQEIRARDIWRSCLWAWWCFLLKTQSEKSLLSRAFSAKRGPHSCVFAQPLEKGTPELKKGSNGSQSIWECPLGKDRS